MFGTPHSLSKVRFETTIRYRSSLGLAGFLMVPLVFDGRQPDLPPVLPLTSVDDLIISCVAQTTNNTGQLIQLPAVTGSVLEADATLEFKASASVTNVGYVAQLLGSYQYANLNGDGDPLAGWTLDGVIDNGTLHTQNSRYGIQEVGLGATYIGMYKDFSLEAGKRYNFHIDMNRVISQTSGTGTSSPWIYVIPPTGLGNAFGGAANGQANVTQTSDPLGGQLVEYTMRHYWNNSFSQYGYGRTLRFNALTTGTYRIWVGMIRQDEVPGFPGTLSTHANNPNRWYTGNYISLCAEAVGDLFETTPNAGLQNRPWDPVLDSGTNRRPLRVSYTAYPFRNYSDLCVFRGGSAKRPPLRMNMRQHMTRATYAADNNRTIPHGFGGDFPYDGIYSFVNYSDHLLGNWIAKRFYFEFTVITSGSNWGVGFGQAGVLREFYSGTNFPGTSLAQWGYLAGIGSSGNASNIPTFWQTYPSGSSTTGYAVLQPGDVIGMAVDLSDPTVTTPVTVTRNGAAYASGYLPGGPVWTNSGLKVWTTGVVQAYGSNFQNVLNFGGPFRHKPPGYIAVDFDNQTSLPPGTLYTSDATWTKPPGLVGVIAYTVGGGGGGGGGYLGSRADTYNGGGHGGGGGGISYGYIAAASLGATEAITVGQGGAGGAQSGPAGVTLGGNVGSAGTSSSFGAHITSGGGAGGNTGFSGGTASTNISAGGSGTLSTGGGGWSLVPNGNPATVYGGLENGSTKHGAAGGGAGGGGTYVGGVAKYAGSRGGNAPYDAVPAGGAGGTSGHFTDNGLAPTDQSGASDEDLTGAGGGGGGCWYPTQQTVNPCGPSGAGGNGGSFGAGGGGGGAGVHNGVSDQGTGGKGGDGADGCVYVIEIF